MGSRITDEQDEEKRVAYEGQPEALPEDYAESTQGDLDASSRGFEGPAHPLPRVRRSHVDYDQYLETPTAKFRIFSAESSRKRRKSLVRGVVVGAIVLAIILWVMFGHA